MSEQVRKRSKAPKWKEFEWLVAKIFHDEYSELDVTVLYNAQLPSKFGKGKERQIDVLVKHRDINTIIECKNYTYKIDIQGVESFLGMFPDTGADFGLMISTSGFTKSAERRFDEYRGKVEHRQLDWEKAYDQSFLIESYGVITDVCDCCTGWIVGKDVPGLLLWGIPYGLNINNKVFLMYVAKCLKCRSHTFYCDSCCVVSNTVRGEYCCDLVKEFSNYYLNELK